MNHIKVELDFIPVEELFPSHRDDVAEDRDLFLKFPGDGRISNGYYRDGLFWMYDVIVHPTHWAEIPEIE